MQIYNYDQRGFYTSTHTLDDSDRDPLNQDQYLIPANSTTLPPPKLEANQVAVWFGSEWQIKLDYRGQNYWLDDVQYTMTELGNYPSGASLDKPISVLAKELEQAKRKAIEQIEYVANQYHSELVGTSDPLKAKRYEQNVVHARAIINNTASDAVIAAMQAQLDANKASNPTVFAAMDLEAFCAWILGLATLAEVAAPYIEVIRITGRAMISSAQDQAGIEAALEQLKVMAQAKFAELTN